MVAKMARFSMVGVMFLAGCRAFVPPRTVGVNEAIQHAPVGPGRPTSAHRPMADRSDGGASTSAPVDSVGHTPANVIIATVNHRPMARARLVDLLLRSGGVGVLEQLIVLDEAAAMAARKGLTVSEADVRREYESALRSLTDPLAEITTGPFDRVAAERALRVVLANRNISHEEFALGMRRRATLRRIAESGLEFTESDIQAEYRRRYGERVVVRHIQLAVARNVDRVRSRLASGEAFSDVAQEVSVNLASAAEGGLLQGFSRDDPAIPELFRKTAFSLKPGAVSDAIHIGPWLHILKLERKLPPDPVPLETVRDSLRVSLRARAVEPRMQRLYEQLFRDARVEIHDPVLRAVFEQAHPDRGAMKK